MGRTGQVPPVAVPLGCSALGLQVDLRQAGKGRVQQAVVQIAGIALAIVVEVLLSTIGRAVAVVAGIENAVSVGVLSGCIIVHESVAVVVLAVALLDAQR